MANNDKNNLDKEEADLRDALLKIVKRHGKFNEDTDGVWAGYTPAIENEIAKIGVKCSNCVFFQGPGSCKVVDMNIEPEGKCRFAVIPKDGGIPGIGFKNSIAAKLEDLKTISSVVNVIDPNNCSY